MWNKVFGVNNVVTKVRHEDWIWKFFKSSSMKKNPSFLISKIKKIKRAIDKMVKIENFGKGPFILTPPKTKNTQRNATSSTGGIRIPIFPPELHSSCNPEICIFTDKFPKYHYRAIPLFIRIG